jgi:hypothetical protein
VLDNSRKAIIVGMKPQKPTFISVATEDDFAIAHYTTEGALYELREGLFVEESHWTHKRNSIIPSDFRLRQGGSLFCFILARSL